MMCGPSMICSRITFQGLKIDYCYLNFDYIIFFSVLTTTLTLKWGFCISLRAKQLGLHF